MTSSHNPHILKSEMDIYYVHTYYLIGITVGKQFIQGHNINERVILQAS